MTSRNRNLLAASDYSGLLAVPRFGIVDSYNPKTYRATVVLQPSPDGRKPITGWLPLLAQFMGAGWGEVQPVQQGDQVAILFMQGHPDGGVILGRVFDEAHPPPTRLDGNAAQAGERVIQDASGNVLQLGNDQRVRINGVLEIDLNGPTINLTATTAVNVTAPAINIGSVGGTLRALLTSLAAAVFNTHTHPSVGASPTQQMTSADETAALKAD
jgi:phage baseplate assembly protein gpV